MGKQFRFFTEMHFPPYTINDYYEKSKLIEYLQPYISP